VERESGGREPCSVKKLKTFSCEGMRDVRKSKKEGRGAQKNERRAREPLVRLSRSVGLIQGLRSKKKKRMQSRTVSSHEEGERGRKRKGLQQKVLFKNATSNHRAYAEETGGICRWSIQRENTYITS